MKRAERNAVMVPEQPGLILCVGACFLLSVAACGEKTQAPSASFESPTVAVPEIRVSAPVHDFGRLPVGNFVPHVFKIKNTGTADLIIEKAEST